MELSEEWTLLTVGLVLLAGYAAHVLGERIHVPRVTLLMVLGVMCGPYVLDLVPSAVADWSPLVAHFALAMVGFLLGESFVGSRLAWLTGKLHKGEPALLEAAGFVFVCGGLGSWVYSVLSMSQAGPSVLFLEGDLARWSRKLLY